MARRSVTLILGATLIGLLFVGSAAVAGDSITLRYANFFPPTHVHSKLPEAWAKEIEKRTDGRVKISYFPGGALTSAPETYDSVVSGICDIGQGIFGYTPGRFPAMTAHENVFGYPSGRAATFIINDFYRKFQPKELTGVKVLYLHAHGPGLLHTRGKPVRKLEDLAGMKIRSAGTTAAVVRRLGGTPVAMSQPEVNDALQKGIVQGTLVPSEALKGFKQGEVLDYTTNCKGVAYSLGAFVVMNLDKWKSLPPDIQKIIDEVDAEWIAKTGEAWDTSDAEGLEFSRGLGNEVIELSPEENARWAAAVAPIADDYIAKTEAAGLPGKEYIAEYRRLMEHYGKP